MPQVKMERIISPPQYLPRLQNASSSQNAASSRNASSSQNLAASQNVPLPQNSLPSQTLPPSENIPPSGIIGVTALNDPTLQIKLRGQSLPAPRDMFAEIANLGNTGAINQWMDVAVNPQDRAYQSQAILARLKAVADIASECAHHLDEKIIKPERLLDQPGGKTNYEELMGFFMQNTPAVVPMPTGTRQERCYKRLELRWSGWREVFKGILPDKQSGHFVEDLYGLAVNQYSSGEALLAIKYAIKDRLSQSGPGQRRTNKITNRDIKTADCILKEWNNSVVGDLAAYLAKKEADIRAKKQQQISALGGHAGGAEGEGDAEGRQAEPGPKVPTELGKLKADWEMVFNLANHGPAGVRTELQSILMPKPGGEELELIACLLREVRARYRTWAPKQSKHGPLARGLDDAGSETGERGKRQKFSHEN